MNVKIIRCIDCDRVLQDAEGAWAVDHRECQEDDAGLRCPDCAAVHCGGGRGESSVDPATPAR